MKTNNGKQSRTLYSRSPKDNSCSSSRESDAEGAPRLGDWESLAAEPHSRSAGIDREDVRGCCCDWATLWLSRPTRSIRISDWFVPVRKTNSEKTKYTSHWQCPSICQTKFKRPPKQTNKNNHKNVEHTDSFLYISSGWVMQVILGFFWDLFCWDLCYIPIQWEKDKK